MRTLPVTDGLRQRSSGREGPGAPPPKAERTGAWTATSRTVLPLPVATSASESGTSTACAPELWFLRSRAGRRRPRRPRRPSARQPQGAAAGAGAPAGTASSRRGRAWGRVEGSPAPTAGGRGWLEPEVIDEPAPRVRVDAESLGLPAGAVEREHRAARESARAAGASPRATRAPARAPVLAQSQARVGPLLDRDQAQLVEPRRLDSQRPLAGDVAESRTPPERKRLAEPRRRRLRLAGRVRLSPCSRRRSKRRASSCSGATSSAYPPGSVTSGSAGCSALRSRETWISRLSASGRPAHKPSSRTSRETGSFACTSKPREQPPLLRARERNSDDL